MKKILLLALLATASFILPSCGDDDEKKQDPEPTAPVAAAIEGKWLVIGIDIKNYDSDDNQVIGGQDGTTYPKDLTATFTAPNLFKEEQPGLVRNGTYTLMGSNLMLNIISPSAFIPGNYQVDTLTANRLVMMVTIAPSGQFAKQTLTYQAKR